MGYFWPFLWLSNFSLKRIFPYMERLVLPMLGVHELAMAWFGFWQSGVSTTRYMLRYGIKFILRKMSNFNLKNLCTFFEIMIYTSVVVFKGPIQNIFCFLIFEFLKILAILCFCCDGSIKKNTKWQAIRQKVKI